MIMTRRIGSQLATSSNIRHYEFIASDNVTAGPTEPQLFLCIRLLHCSIGPAQKEHENYYWSFWHGHELLPVKPLQAMVTANHLDLSAVTLLASMAQPQFIFLFD